MGRLIPKALYSNEPVEEHYLRAVRRGEVPCDVTDPDARWEILAERIREIDPNGKRSASLLIEVLAKK